MSALCQKRTLERLLNHLVSGHLQRQRQLQAEGLGGFEIDDELEFGRLLHRQLIVAIISTARRSPGEAGGGFTLGRRPLMWLWLPGRRFRLENKIRPEADIIQSRRQRQRAASLEFPSRVSWRSRD
jgi:hypothetical protein